MNSLWAHRGLAILLLLMLIAGGLALPALADNASEMEAVIDQLDVNSHTKLEWLDTKLDTAATEAEAQQYYNSTVWAIGTYSAQAVIRLYTIAGGDPELMAAAQSLVSVVYAMSEEHDRMAREMFDAWTPPTTTTTKVPESTTTTTLPTPSTSTTTSTTIVPTSTTTTTTIRATTTTTSPPPITPTTSIARSAPGSTTTSTTAPVPPSTTTTTTVPPLASTIGSGGSTPGDFSATFDDAPMLASSAFGEVPPYVDEVASLMQMDDSPARGFLLRYVPADLPAGMARPVVGVVAIIEMIVGAFVASFERLGGPATAASLYVTYSVWQYVRKKAPVPIDL